jgi:hypothetical protein
MRAVRLSAIAQAQKALNNRAKSDSILPGEKINAVLRDARCCAFTYGVTFAIQYAD